MHVRRGVGSWELPRDRYYRWIGERDPAALSSADLAERSSAPMLVANRLTTAERAAMLQIARDEAHATQRHRKLAHTARPGAGRVRFAVLDAPPAQ